VRILVLRSAEDRDRDAILAWRNHPEVRAVSLSKHLITVDEHAAWWIRTIRDPSRQVLVYERAGTPCGVVNFFDITDVGGDRSAWWGFFLDVDGLQARGELLTAWLEIMREAVDHAVDELRLDVLHGEVLAENEGVRAGNRRLRVRELGTEQRVIDGETKTIVRLALHAEDVRARRAALARRAHERVTTSQQGSSV
jgi:RimJ/RimL family protein N-acetyltransferase